MSSLLRTQQTRRQILLELWHGLRHRRIQFNNSTLARSVKCYEELAEMKIDMEQVKIRLANTTDPTATILEILTKINRNQMTISEPAVKIFLEQKLCTMANGKWGERESGIVTEPI
jgi:hypothetical protein